MRFRHCLPLIGALLCSWNCLAESPKGGTAKSTAKTKAQPQPKKPEIFSAEVLELQGVWSVDEGAEGPRVARLIVHGSYFLLIYEWTGKDATVVEVSGFQADGNKIYDAEGQPVLTYLVTDKKSVSFEVLDPSDMPTSKYCEFAMVRRGKLPDLQLPRAPAK